MEPSVAAIPQQDESSTLTRPLAVIVCLILVLVACLLSLSLYYQHSNYSEGVAKALNDQVLDHAAVLSYSRAWDIAVMKTSAMCCGFLLTFLGALYVLKSRDNAYRLRLSGMDKQNTLETSSPGLVMITFGVALVITSILKETSVEYTAPSQILSPAGGRGQPVPDSKPDIPAASEPTG
jgi:hypothetical protein